MTEDALAHHMGTLCLHGTSVQDIYNKASSNRIATCYTLLQLNNFFSFWQVY